MEGLPISDIVANLKSAFREKDFEDAELALITSERKLRNERAEMEVKYSAALKEQFVLRNRCDKLGREKDEETKRRIELEEKCRVYAAELEGFRKKIAGLEAEKRRSAPGRMGKSDGDGGLLEKIRGLEEEKMKILRRAGLAESRVREGKAEIAIVLKKIEGVEEEKRVAERLLEKVKSEADRKESELRGEIEKHLWKIECLKKNHETVMAEAEEHRKAYLRFKAMVHSLIGKRSPGDAQPTSHRPSDVGAHRDVKDISDTVARKSPTGTHPPNGLKRNRDSFRASSMTVAVDDSDDVNLTRRHKPKASDDLSNGSPSLVTPGYGTSSTNSVTAESCRGEKLAASWQFEADMLAAFEKVPTWSMQAVCALYRQKNSRSSGSPLASRRGFNGLDALRGAALAEFLLDRDPQGSMKRSVEELERHDPFGLDVCKRIALTHSKQLFEIYKSREDPFFGPS